MKSNVLKKTKKMAAFMTAAALALGVFFAVPTEAEAAGNVITEDEVKYVEYSNCTLGKAPTYTGVNDNYGYLFGGWYTKDASGKWDPIYDDADKAAATRGFYAKFVPAYVLSVRCQNYAGTTQDSGLTAMRIVSSVDSRNYKKVGFELTKITKNGDGTYSSATIGTNGDQETTETYYGLNVYTSTGDTSPARYSPQGIFGTASKYLTAWSVNRIPQAYFGTIICIRPYWVTPDGVTVYGLTKYAHVEDGYLEYINVPVNLNNANAVAAGLLNVNFDNGKLQFVEAERGVVFEEMATNGVQDKGIVKCVGNASDISGNKESNNIYVNLRFKVIGGFKTGNNAFTFTVNGENFGTAAENIVKDYNVWNVKASVLK